MKEFIETIRAQANLSKRTLNLNKLPQTL